MVRIFLAHASEDKDAVIGLYNRLKAKGFKPWLDKKDLLGGQRWDDEIQKAINSSDVFLACLSKRSVAKQGYVQREFKIALQKCGDLPEGKIYLIPLRLDDCEIPNLRQREYGINIRDYQWVDYFEDDGFDQLVRTIDYHFPQPASNFSSPVYPTQSTSGQPFIARQLKTIGQSLVDVSKTASGKQKFKDATPRSFERIYLSKDVPLDFIHIPGGTFLMGSPEGEGDKSEHPQHQVTVPEFWMGRYPVTQAQYQAVIGKNPSTCKGRDIPVQCISCDDAVEFCRKVHWKTGKKIRLPSEAEWEYACRAGTTTAYYFGDRLTEKQATYSSNIKIVRPSSGEKHPANAFGLYDMHGNVWEWCLDRWHEDYYGAPTDGSAWEIGESQAGVMRGGSWYDNVKDCRSARRYCFMPDSRNLDFGFRVVYSAPRIPR